MSSASLQNSNRNTARRFNGSGNGKQSARCEVCGKTLADPSSLYRHRKIHSGDKPHECEYCGRRFIQRYNMTQHVKTHFKERGINSLAHLNFPAVGAAAGIGGPLGPSMATGK